MSGDQKKAEFGDLVADYPKTAGNKQPEFESPGSKREKLAEAEAFLAAISRMVGEDPSQAVKELRGDTSLARVFRKLLGVDEEAFDTHWSVYDTVQELRALGVKGKAVWEQASQRLSRNAIGTRVRSIAPDTVKTTYHEARGMLRSRLLADLFFQGRPRPKARKKG